MEERERAVGGAIAVPVVGIGASAGGLEAIGELLTNLPAGTGMAFLLVQHLDPNHPTMLPEILAKKTAMPVCEASEDQAVQPDHLYVIPPNAVMTIDQGRLRLTPRRDTPGPPMPIDELFYSLGDQQGRRSIGVVLSGTGSDGAKGMQALKHAGGITIAQDEASARFPDMPRAAAALEAVDFVLAPAAIAHEIARIGRHPYLSAEQPRSIAESIPADEGSLARIFRLLRAASGVDFTHYKRPTVKRRLARRLALHHLQTVDEYVGFLEATPGEAAALCSDLLIRVTRFFREPKAYEALGEIVFPRLLEQRPPKAPVRIWVPGCASGEEVYSIAICLLEFLGERASTTPIQIFGTDLSESAIEAARAGCYDENIAGEVSPERLLRFFVKSNAHYRIAHSIRDLCVFAKHDVTHDPPFSRQDLISCQNLLIYLEPVLQQRVIPLFHYALKPGGALVLGPAETIGPGFSDRFSVLEGNRAKIFVKTQLPGSLPYESPVPLPRRPYEPGVAASESPQEPSERETLEHEADRVVLARYAPASVLCDEELNILQFRGDTGPFLTHAPGAPSLNLQRLARPGLDIEIIRAVRQARADARPVRKTGLRIQASDGFRELSLEVIPVGGGMAPGHFLICFEAPSHATAPRSATTRGTLWASLRTLFRPGTRPLDATQDQEIAQLTQELATAREHVRSMREVHESALEELKSAQEELLSSNEEFQSTNEELETSKEELQAGNEELVTTNEELQHRNLELARLNLDLENAREASHAIVETIAQPILILDEKLGVVRTNAAFLEKFQTTSAATLNRSVYALGDGQWDIPDLRRLLEEVLPEETSIENFEVRHVFPGIGAKTMRISARRLRLDAELLIFLAIDDVTERQAVIDELDAASHRKDEFLAMLGHELRNPLAAMRNALELWRRPEAPVAARTRAESILDWQLRKETRLVDDLLDVSRISRGAISLQQTPVDLARIVALAVEEMRHELESRRHELTVSLPPGGITVMGDAIRLEQVVANLLANSAKFTQPGGHIGVALGSEENTAVLRVSDDGCGIAAEQLSTVFEIFFQAERSLDQNAGGGLGLGLTLVRRLTEMHGGTVEARSPGRGHGSEFVVRLPISIAPPVPAAIPKAKRPEFAPRRILVVDDNFDSAESLTMLLQMDGHDVRMASDGQAALDAARSFDPQIVLLDIGLPGMDGYEVAGRLRELPGGARTVVVAVTGYGRPEDRERAREARFDHYLLKPIDFGALAAILAA